MKNGCRAVLPDTGRTENSKARVALRLKARHTNGVLFRLPRGLYKSAGVPVVPLLTLRRAGLPNFLGTRFTIGTGDSV